MPTESILNKRKKKLKYLHSKKEMIKSVYTDNPTEANKNKFYAILDDIDDELDKYYSDTIMFLKEQKNDLFETYLALKKETVKLNLYAVLVSDWENEKKNTPTISEQKFDIRTELKK